jgi:cell division protein FtsZ
VPGLINLDFADVRTVMKDAGSALMGIGRASGEGRAAQAARDAISSPLLEVNISGAQGVLFNVTGGSSLSLYEVDEAAEIVKATADPEANIIFGTVIDERMGDEIAITVIATGFDASRRREQTHAQVTEMAQVLRSREREQQIDQRVAAAIPISSTGNGDSLPVREPAAAAASSRPSDSGLRRGPQQEVEDLDIPAFLRRRS